MKEQKEQNQISTAFNVLKVAAAEKTKSFLSKAVKPTLAVLLLFGIGFMIYTQVKLTNDVKRLQAISVPLERPIVDDVQEYDLITNESAVDAYVENDSIPFDVYMNARKLAKIQYYIDITDRRPANKTFFFGWIKRTMAE